MYDPMMQAPTEYSGEMLANTDDMITELKSKTLSASQKERLSSLISSNNSEGKLDIHSEIRSQYLLIDSIRSDLLDPKGHLREGMEAREIQTIIGLFNSFMTLYLRSMEKLDRDKELSQIEQAVQEAMAIAPEETQKTFLVNLERFMR